MIGNAKGRVSLCEVWRQRVSHHGHGLSGIRTDLTTYPCVARRRWPQE